MQGKRMGQQMHQAQSEGGEGTVVKPLHMSNIARYPRKQGHLSQAFNASACYVIGNNADSWSTFPRANPRIFLTIKQSATANARHGCAVPPLGPAMGP